MNDSRREVISSELIVKELRIINPLSTSKVHEVDFTDYDNFY